MQPPPVAEHVRDELISALGSSYDFYEVQAVVPTGDEVTVALNVSEGISAPSTYGGKVEHLCAVRVDLFSFNHPALRTATREVMDELERMTGFKDANMNFVEVNFSNQSYIRDKKQEYETSIVNLNITVIAARS